MIFKKINQKFAQKINNKREKQKYADYKERNIDPYLF